MGEGFIKAELSVSLSAAAVGRSAVPQFGAGRSAMGRRGSCSERVDASDVG